MMLRFTQSLNLHKDCLKSLRSLYTGSCTMEKKDHLEQTADKFRAPEKLPARITEVKDISPSVRSLTLAVDKDKITSTFKAGQWVDFFIPGVEQVGGFSMWSSPDSFSKTGELQLAIKNSTWPPAHWAHTKCKEGDNVEVRFGGEFFYPTDDIQTTDNHSLLLIGGGVGINPLLSIWLQSRDQWKSDCAHKPRRVSLLYSATRTEELIFKGIVNCTREEFSNFSSQFFISRSGKGCTGRMGDTEISSRLSELKPGRVICYLCGPPVMIRDVEATLLNLQVPKEDIRYELWY